MGGGEGGEGCGNACRGQVDAKSRAPPRRVSTYVGEVSVCGRLAGWVGRVHQLGADLLLRAALDEQARSREQPLLRLRAPTCLGLPTHGALYRNLGAVRAAEAGSTVNWTELFMSIHSCSIHIHSRCLVKYLGVS